VTGVGGIGAAIAAGLAANRRGASSSAWDPPVAAKAAGVPIGWPGSPSRGRIWRAA
jgi:hypothetical protein